MNDISISQIQNAVAELVKKFHPQKVFLFGSYANGTPTADSDVDLLVAMETPLRSVDQAVKIREAIHFDFPLDLLVRTPEQLQKRLKMGDPFIQEIVAKGKVLYEAA
jgi:predicted nucleotidyltransferase